MKNIYLIIFLYAIINLSLPVSGNDICNDLVCCPITCNNCTVCIGDQINDIMCCEKNILESNKTCTLFQSPCIKNSTPAPTTTQIISPALVDKILKFLTIPNIIYLCIGFVLFLCVVYACTCFDRRKPPISYKEITWSKDTVWIHSE